MPFSSPLSLAILGAGALATAVVTPAQHERVRHPSFFHHLDKAFTFARPSFGVAPNGQTHVQDMFVSHAGFQYATWWNADRHVTVGRRRAGLPNWEQLVLTDYTIPGQDSHNAVVLGLCPGDGTLHLSFDHHGDDLNYRVSVPGLVTTPLQFAWTPTLFGPVVDRLDPARSTVTRVTYPRFVTTPLGDLQFLYREFSSGDGRMRLVDYDAAAGTWSNDHVIIERTGSHTDPIGGTSTRRNPYYNRIAYDSEGTLHATWTWRERATIRYNRDIAYAFSEDRGRTWKNGAGQVVGTPAAPLRADSPSINAITLGAEWGLMNDQGHVVDSRGRVHVVMYHKTQPDTVVSYGNATNSKYHHYWLGADGSWRSQQLATVGNRPKLVVDRDDNLYLLYVDTRADFAVDMATPAGDFADWRTLGTLDGAWISSVQPDHGQFTQANLLTLALQELPVVRGDSSRLAWLDLPVPTQPATERPWAVRQHFAAPPVERDAWVESGANSNAAFGTGSLLRLSRAGPVDPERLAFVRFDLADLLAGGAVERAIVRLQVATAPARWAEDHIDVRRCARDAWSEWATTYATRPLPDGPAMSAPGGTAVVDVDVTDAIARELARGGGRITFEIANRLLAPGHVVELRARESGLAMAPKLLVQQHNALLPLVDTFVRGGVHANTSFDGRPELSIKDDPNADFDRMALLRFDASRLRGTGDIRSVWLVAHRRGAGPLARTTPYRLHLVADDTWTGAVTWFTRPALGAVQSAHFGRKDMLWDVTDRVLDAMSSDGLLSVALTSAREESSRTLNLHASEGPDATRPRLVVRYR